MNDKQLTINQLGLSSMVVLIIVVLSVFVVWEISQYTTQFSEPPKKNQNGSRECVGGPDVRDCDDTYEGTGPISYEGLTGPSEADAFGWRDDGKP